MASSDLREELNCSVCLNIYTDPVTLPCGHSFCRRCMENVLDTQERSGAYSCPDCRAAFVERPALRRSTALCNVAKCVRAISPDPGVVCSYCVNRSIPAVKTCLMCEASLCETHLQVHCKSAEHVLTQPTTSSGNIKCPVHREVLKYFCCHDGTCVCVSCCLAGDHRGHHVELLDEASEKTKEKMRNVLKKLGTKRDETEENIHHLQKHIKEIQEQAFSAGKRVTTLLKDIRAELKALEKRVHSELSRQENHLSRQVSDQVQRLEVKKEELTRRMRPIEELCDLMDPLMVLKERETRYRQFFKDEDDSELEQEEEEGDWEEAYDEDETWDEEDETWDEEDETWDEEDETWEEDEEDETWEEDEEEDDEEEEEDMEDEADGEDQEEERFDSVGGLDEGSIAMMLHKALPDIVNNERRDFYVRQAEGLLLDLDTAAYSITISDDLRMISPGSVVIGLPTCPGRFEYSQVLSSCSFSSGRIFWDVETSEAGDWCVGMAYPSIEREGSSSTMGYNAKSWSLSKWSNRYLATHDSRENLLPSDVSRHAFRIYLDYEAGQISFYELCDPMRHLHTFTTTFSEPLQAAFHVWKGREGTDIPYIKLLL